MSVMCLLRFIRMYTYVYVCVHTYPYNPPVRSFLNTPFYIIITIEFRANAQFRS